MLQTCFGSSEAFGVWIPGWQGKVLSVGDVQMLEGGKEKLQDRMFDNIEAIYYYRVTFS